MKENESPEETRANLAAQLDEVILRMRSILVSKEATHGAATWAAEQIVAAAKAKARRVGAEAPARQIIKLNYVSEEALAEEREQLEATLTAMGVDLSVLRHPRRSLSGCSPRGPRRRAGERGFGGSC